MPVPTDVTPNTRVLLRDDVYLRLRDAIVDGTFLPGEQLRDAELANWLGVSRTPIREALLRLGQAGLVISEPGKSTQVTEVDPKEVRDAQLVIEAIHEVALRQAIDLFTKEHLLQMQSANSKFAKAIKTKDIDAAIEADDEFHVIPIQVSGNLAALTIIEQFSPVLRRVERLKFSSSSAANSIELHKQLIEYCKNGDLKGAIQVSHATWSSLDELTISAESVSLTTKQSEQKEK